MVSLLVHRARSLAVGGGSVAARSFRPAATKGRARFRAAAEAAPAAACAVLRETNVCRAAAGLRPLAWDPRLTNAARSHAADMARRGYFAHDSPEGATVAHRVGADRSAYVALGENLAMGMHDARQAVNGWMQSAGHRGNLLHPIFDRLGVAVVDGPSGPVWVQVFGAAR